jgi:hypothetical protein
VRIGATRVTPQFLADKVVLTGLENATGTTDDETENRTSFYIDGNCKKVSACANAAFPGWDATLLSIL